MSIKKRLFIWFVIASVIPLILIGGFSYYLIVEKISRQNEETLANINTGIYNMVDIQQKVLSLWMQSSAAAFQDQLALLGPSSFDENNRVNLAGHSLPTWYVGKQKITGDFMLVDKMLEKQNVGVTIFQMENETFIRASTNVRKPDGSRIMDTVLDPGGPVYRRLIQGLPYNGRANVEGAMWGVVYQPIRNQDGKMIGAFVIGRKEQEYEVLNAIKKIVIGSTGYVFVLDSEGTAIIHPTLQGKKLLEYPWIKEILQKKNGAIVYEMDGRKKISQYIYYEPWDWYIVTGAYESEIFNTTRELSFMLLMTLLAAIGISSAIAYVLSNTFSKPINDCVKTMRLAQSGNLSSKMNYQNDDEFRALSDAFNAMLDNISLLIGRILSNSTRLKEASDRLILDITESNRSLKGIENTIEQLKQSPVATLIDTRPVGSFIRELQQMLYSLELLTAENIAADSNKDVEKALSKMETILRSMTSASHVDEFDPSNLSALGINKIISLEVEVQKLNLLLKNIHSSAESLDDIAYSLDRHVKAFKIEDNE